MNRVLLLNADWTPLNFITEHRAIMLLYKKRVEIITNMAGRPSVWDVSFASPTASMKVPATIRLLTRVRSNQRPPRFRKKVLFNRDNWQCLYCNEIVSQSSATVDHIFPRSRGGQNSWKNCATACKRCNKHKANRTPDEAGMKLLKTPTQPTSLHFWDVSQGRAWHSDWNLFIEQNV